MIMCQIEALSVFQVFERRLSLPLWSFFDENADF